MGIGENIKKFRQAYNMEQKDLADRLHVSSKTISSWECGRTEPKMGMIEDLADVFRVSKTDIIEGKVYQSFDTAEEFELYWHESSGGLHPITLTDKEHSLIIKYRAVPEEDKKAIDRLLEYATRITMMQKEDK